MLRCGLCLLRIVISVRCYRPVQQCLDDLSPSFQLDYLLPRTLLSVMSVEHIEHVFASMVVPPDACLANAFYFVHTDYTLDDKVCYVI